MTLAFQSRPSDFPHVQAIGSVHAASAAMFTVVPDGSWGLIVHRSAGATTAYLTGLTTRPVRVALQAGDEILSVSLAASAFSPDGSAAGLLDKARMLSSAGSRKVWWSPRHKIELPTLETADDFVCALVKREQLILNETVATVLAGHTPYTSPRTLQRHFMQTTGMTHNYWMQIQRAQKAMSALRLGKPLAQVAHESGYVDQSHMTRWLKQIVGRTPAAIARENDSHAD